MNQLDCPCCVEYRRKLAEAEDQLRYMVRKSCGLNEAVTLWLKFAKFWHQRLATYLLMKALEDAKTATLNVWLQ